MTNFLFPVNVRNIFFSVNYYLAFSVPEKVRQDSGIEGSARRLQKPQKCSQLSPLTARKLSEASIIMDVFC